MKKFKFLFVDIMDDKSGIRTGAIFKKDLKKLKKDNEDCKVEIVCRIDVCVQNKLVPSFEVFIKQYKKMWLIKQLIMSYDELQTYPNSLAKWEKLDDLTGKISYYKDQYLYGFFEEFVKNKKYNSVKMYN